MRTTKRKLIEDKEETNYPIPFVSFCLDKHLYCINTNPIAIFLEDFKEQSLTFCFCLHQHDDTFLKFPIQLNHKTSLTIFIHLLNNVDDDNVKTIDVDETIDFQEIKLLCNYFNTIQHVTLKIKQMINDFVLSNVAITLVSAWEFLNDKQINEKQEKIYILHLLHIDHEKILHCEYIKIIKRLKFLINHGFGDKLSIVESITCEKASSLLNIAQEIVNILNYDTAVISGGASMYLGCPWSTFTMKSDIDIFILNTDQKFKVLKNLQDILTSLGYILFQFGKSVVTCLNEYGTRIIQLILSPYSDPMDVILNFDLMPLKCFYDGIKLYKLINTHYDWINKKVSTRSLCELKPMRIYNLFHKGFQLDDQYITFLKSTIGWPLEADKINQYLYDIPYINKHIPMEVNVALLKKRGLKLVENINKLKCFELDSKYIGKQNATFFGEYINALSQITFSNTEIKKHTWYFINISCPYSFKVKNVNINLQTTKPYVFDEMNCLKDIATFENDLISKYATMKNILFKNKGMEFTLKCIKNKNLKMFKNGIPYLPREDEFYFERVSLNITPFYLYHDGHISSWKVRWLLNCLFCS